MPQLAFETFIPQLAWLVLVFLALYVLMARVALPRIGAVIDGRQARIAGDLQEAAQLKAQTEKAIQDYEAALAAARAKAHGIAQETRNRLSEETDRQRAEIEANLDAKIAEAEASIAATKTEALKNVRSVAIDVTEAIVAELLKEGADKAAVESAVDSELK
jgi:F-type H+-transporting ATPase subunit b